MTAPATDTVKKRLAALQETRVRPFGPTIHVSGISLLMLSAGMLVSFFVEWGYADPYSNNEWPLLISSIAVFAVGGAMWVTSTPGASLRPKAVFSIVTWTWVLSAVAGAVPLLLSDMFTWKEWDLALFEAVSGLSCTGSTVLTDIEANGKGVLMWRQLIQWYGGMGMVVLALTVLPFLGVGGLSLMSAESPGEGSDRLAHRMSETAKRLWTLYAGFTALVAVALWSTPQVGLYDAIGHAVTTAATGGFSTRGNSIGTYDSVLVEIIVICGMLAGGVNFNLHYRALSGDFRVYRRSSDTRLYFYIFVAAATAVTLINWHQGVLGFGSSLRHGAFNVASLLSSTGFGSASGPGSPGDFVAWAPGAVMILLLLFIVGGSVGSTSGGVKVFRVQVAFAHMVRQIQRTRHPRGIVPVKIGRDAIPESIVNRVLGFLTMFFMIAMTATLTLTLIGIPLMESGAAVLNAMSNMGPGLGPAGPTGSFLVYPRSARLILAAMMLIGRLELTAVVMVLSSVVATFRRQQGKFLQRSRSANVTRRPSPWGR